MALFQLEHCDIWYEQSDSTGQDILLLHNAGGDHRFLSPQFQHFSQFGRVTTLDLPGHGKSSLPLKSELGIENISEIILSFANNIGLSDVCIIGLNYGANIGMEILAKNASFVKSFVMLDPPIFLSQTVRKLITEHLDDLRNNNQEDYARALVDNSFVKISEKNKKVPYEVFKNMSHQILINVYRDLLVWDKDMSLQRLREINIPALCIMTDASLCDVEQMSRENARINVAKVVGSLYWATLEVPEQTNAMIDRFLYINNVRISHSCDQ